MPSKHTFSSSCFRMLNSLRNGPVTVRHGTHTYVTAGSLEKRGLARLAACELDGGPVAMRCTITTDGLAALQEHERDRWAARPT